MLVINGSLAITTICLCNNKQAGTAPLPVAISTVQRQTSSHVALDLLVMHAPLVAGKETCTELLHASVVARIGGVRPHYSSTVALHIDVLWQVPCAGAQTTSPLWHR